MTSLRNRESTRRRLLDSGFEVFAHDGIARAGIGEICNRAGFSRGAFYSNFASKEELFMQLYREEIDARAERLHRSFADATDIIGRRPAAFSARWLTELVLDSFSVEHAHDEQWFLMTSEAEVLGMRDHTLGLALAAAQTELVEDIAAVIEHQLTRHRLLLNMPVQDAVVVVIGLYESTLKTSMLTGSFEAARATCAALIPRLTDALVRVLPGAASAADLLPSTTQE